MFVVLDGKRFIGALVDVAAAGAVAVFVPTTDMRDGEALHVSAQVAGLARTKHQVPVVGHQAIGQHPHVDMTGDLEHHTLKGVVVGGLVENLHPPVATIEYVKDHPAGLDACCAWHGLMIHQQADQLNVLIPFFLSRGAGGHGWALGVADPAGAWAAVVADGG